MRTPSTEINKVYAKLKAQGSLSGLERHAADWLGCSPETLRSRAQAEGHKVAIKRARPSGGEVVVTVTYLD